MPLLAHLSDLHFGRTDPRVVEALIADLNALHPDVVVISGDLTQRARSRQFAEARRFLERVNAPSVLVPGNHDLAPLYRPLDRLLRPRARFFAHLSGHADQTLWRDSSLVVVGLDSTRAMRWTSGKLRSGHLDHLDDVLAQTPETACKVAFLHHPPATALAGHPFESLAERGIDLVLTGHAHKARIGMIAAGASGSSILLQASTACSTRLREEANGYGVIRINMPEMLVEVRGWSGEAFHCVHQQGFAKSQGQWRPG